MLTIDQLEAEAAKLTPTERVELIVRLQSFDDFGGYASPEIEAAWDEEIRRRIADVDAGKADWRDAIEFLSELRAGYRL